MRAVLDVRRGWKGQLAGDPAEPSPQDIPPAVSVADLEAALKAKGMLSDVEIAAAISAKE